MQPSHTLFLMWNHSVVPCLVLEATGPLCFLWKLLEGVSFWHKREENEKMKHLAFRSQEPRKERGEGTARMTEKGSQEEQLCPEPQSSWSRMEKRMRGLPRDTPAFQILSQQENNTRNAAFNAPQCSLQPGQGKNPDVHKEMNGQRSCGAYTQWGTTQPWKGGSNAIRSNGPLLDIIMLSEVREWQIPHTWNLKYDANSLT